jgi:hypothetical protein
MINSVDVMGVVIGVGGVLWVLLLMVAALSSVTYLCHCIFLSPFLGVFIVDGPVGFVDAGDLGHERIVRVRIAQQWAYG